MDKELRARFFISQEKVILVFCPGDVHGSSTGIIRHAIYSKFDHSFICSLHDLDIL